MKNTHQQSPLSLRDLCLEIVTFRRHLLERRANVASPGYHIDLDEAKAGEAAEFLRTVPALCAAIAGKIIAYHLATGTETFSAALESLQVLNDKPQLVFSLRARAIHEHYFVSDIIFSEIIKPQEDPEMFIGGEI